MVALLGIHSIVYTYFVATGKWAKEVVHAYQLPDWIGTQATKNKRRAFRFIMGSMTAIAVAAWLGAAADTRGPAYALWHLAAAAFAIAFNLGFVRGRIRRDRRSRPASDRAQGPRRSAARRTVRTGTGACRRAENASDRRLETDPPVASPLSERTSSWMSPAVTRRRSRRNELERGG